jgi:hypothetical protein
MVVSLLSYGQRWESNMAERRKEMKIERDKVKKE